MVRLCQLEPIGQTLSRVRSTSPRLRRDGIRRMVRIPVTKSTPSSSQVSSVADTWTKRRLHMIGRQQEIKWAQPPIGRRLQAWPSPSMWVQPMLTPSDRGKNSLPHLCWNRRITWLTHPSIREASTWTILATSTVFRPKDAVPITNSNSVSKDSSPSERTTTTTTLETRSRAT